MTTTEIGELVKARRIKKGLSYRDLAEACGLSRDGTAIIRKVENGEEYKLSTLAKICAALDLAVVVQPIRKKVTER